MVTFVVCLFLLTSTRSLLIEGAGSGEIIEVGGLAGPHDVALHARKQFVRRRDTSSHR